MYTVKFYIANVTDISIDNIQLIHHQDYLITTQTFTLVFLITLTGLLCIQAALMS